MYTISSTPFYLATDDTHHPGAEFRRQPSIASSWDNMEGVEVVGGDEADTFQVWTQRRAARIANTSLFKRAALVLIFVCGIVLAVRTQYPSSILDRMLDVLLVIFSVELVLTTVFYQEQLAGWLALDMLVIGVCWFSGDRSALALRSFRLLRSLRKASGFPAVRGVVKAVLRALPRLAAVCGVMLPGSLLIFAVWLANLYPEEPQFARLDSGLLVLLQIMTGGVSWAETLQAMDEHNYAWIPLSCFVIVAQFIFISLIIGIMSHSVHTVNDNERIWKTPTGARSGPDEVEKLERKVDELSSTVEQLLRGQAQLLEALSRREESPVPSLDS